MKIESTPPDVGLELLSAACPVPDAQSEGRYGVVIAGASFVEPF